jgi:integrase
MARPAKGSLLINANGYSARVRVGPDPKDRQSFGLAVTNDEAATERAELLAVALHLRPFATADEIAVVVKAAGDARTVKAMNIALEGAVLVGSGKTSSAKSSLSPTFEDFADEWTSGKLHTRFPDHVRAKDPERDVQVFRDYVNPKIGPTPIGDITLEHAERVMAGLRSDLAPRSRKLIAQSMRKLLSLAVYPGRHLAANPIPREWMPKIMKSANKAKTCLYPEEDARLLGCVRVDLQRRLAYGILSREGMRRSELSGLRWRDLDLDHGRIRLDVNKTDDPRAWALSPDVVRTLVWWKKRTKGEAADLVLGLDLAHAARWLRGLETRESETGDLRTAGVTRPELFERTASRQPIRLHDLRATFVTVSLANGKTEQWVSDRTGHKSSQMIATYTRQARTWSELGMGTLGALDELLPEVSATALEDAPALAIERAAVAGVVRSGEISSPEVAYFQGDREFGSPVPICKTDIREFKSHLHL